ncbi:MAG: polynucleotide adenylyltransferase, partial [Lachnospiraceae bacterium]|nr:polynucleotide adenylyltransferase [Lachnospiraceae bacterium]
MSMDKINMPAGAEYIIEQLNKHGFEAYIVGGCVRDSLLGKVPNDWDITTSANPYEVKKIFRKTIDTGIQHGTVTVMVD